MYDGAVRLLAYNIHKGVGGRDRRYRLDRILAVIAHEKPDLLCVQEATRDAPRCGRDDQPEILAYATGAVARHFQFNVHWKAGGYGNLLLSRWPVVRYHHIPLGYRGRKPRGGQVALVESPSGRFVLANWHLGLGDAERRWQAARLLGHPHLLKWSRYPAVLAGDSNDWRDVLARRALADAGFRHVTAPARRFRTYPAYVPVGSLDKIFVRGGIIVDAVRVVRAAISRAASDHLPVAMDFRLAE